MRSRDLKWLRFTVNKEFEQNRIPYGQPGLGRWKGPFRSVRIGKKGKPPHIISSGPMADCARCCAAKRGLSLSNAGDEHLVVVRGRDRRGESDCRHVPDSSASQALDRCSFIRTADDGTRRTQANSPKPAVYTDVRMLEKFVGVPNSLTMQFRISERTPSTCLWKISRSGRNSVRILDQVARGTTDR